MSNKSIEELEKEIEMSKRKINTLEKLSEIKEQQIKAERANDNFSVGCTIFAIVLIILGFIFFPEFMS